MEKNRVILWSLAALWTIPSPLFAGEIWRYALSPTQEKFYLLILYTIAFSTIMVASAYFFFWLLDLRKKVKESKTAKSLDQELVDLKNNVRLLADSY